MIPFVGIVLGFLITGPAIAKDQDGAAREIEHELMAPCCWTQTVDQHTSGVSKEIRQNVRKMLSEGQKKDDIIQFYVARYGERILAMPPARGFQMLAYVLPGLFLIAGGWGVVTLVQKWKQQAAVEAPDRPVNITQIELERLERELQEHV